MGNCKDNCIMVCSKCGNYEDSFENGEFSGKGECKESGTPKECTDGCNSFKCKCGSN